MPNHWKKIRKGSRIAVYFKNPGCYYACKVIDKETDSRKCSNFLVRYEDNSELWTNLARSKFRWEDYYVNTDDEEEELIYSSEEEEEEMSYDGDSKEEEEEKEKEELSGDEEAVEKIGAKMFIDDEALEVNEQEKYLSDKESMSDDGSEMGAAANDGGESHKIGNSKGKISVKESRKVEDKEVGKGFRNLEEEEDNKESETQKDEDSVKDKDNEKESDAKKEEGEGKGFERPKGGDNDENLQP